MAADEHLISTMTHGRYLLAQHRVTQASFLIAGFHGYSENADIHLRRLQEIHIEDCHYCSIQGLHTFYRQKHIAASWMSSQNREAHIQDNIAYIDAVLSQLSDKLSWDHLIFAGFSQGAAMAYRSAALGAHTCDALIINGGDVPPELSEATLQQLPPLLIMRGTNDQAYSQQQLELDCSRLKTDQTETQQFQGPHSWPTAASAIATEFLHQLFPH